MRLPPQPLTPAIPRSASGACRGSETCVLPRSHSVHLFNSCKKNKTLFPFVVDLRAWLLVLVVMALNGVAAAILPRQTDVSISNPPDGWVVEDGRYIPFWYSKVIDRFVAAAFRDTCR
jgi:hypothetical protein